LLVNGLVLHQAIDTEALAAQRKQRRSKRVPKKEIPNPLADSKADIVNAAKEHRLNLEKVVSLLEGQEKRSSETLEKKKALFAAGIVARREVEEAERDLASIRANITLQKGEIAQTDTLIAEAAAAEQIARLAPKSINGYVATAALIRYTGPTAWLLSDIAKVEQFFSQRFGRALPISALGQSPVHNNLGFDHHNAADIAAHPDSLEGQALMTYLRGAGISFIAFRQAVPGSATGAHIHIGAPSRRLAR
jgi:hypothetical protein